MLPSPLWFRYFSFTNFFWRHRGLNSGPHARQALLLRMLLHQPLGIFQIGPQPSYLYFLSSWDHSCLPLCPAIAWDGVQLTFLLRLASYCNPCLPSSWDDRHEPLYPVPLFFIAVVLFYFPTHSAQRFDHIFFSWHWGLT
jgi:hypothetical protein